MGRKKGQLKLSFGMIFSIILIIVFVAFAFYVINIFVGLQSSSNSVKLKNDLQSDVDKVWKSAESKQDFEYLTPSGVDYVCFLNRDSDSGKGESRTFFNDLKRTSFDKDNLVLYSLEDSNPDIGSFEIENIDIGQTTILNNPLCFKESSGKIKITLKKDFDGSLVTVMK